MKLHRLVLANYRGVTHREIVFPDSGVILISGANEIGKSSMIEAIDLLLEAKDRSTKKDVKQVKPTHADVGAEVTAEISTGPYRFIYRKRFHKRCETELTVLAPRREQLTGDEAHERVCTMLADTVDTGLWRAQRVLQAASTSAVDLSGCDALSRALDVAAGRAEELTGSESGHADGALIDRIEEECGRYFTATGRPTGDWAVAVTRITAAEAEVARCAAAVAEVEDALHRHAVLTDQLAELTARRKVAAQRFAAAKAAAVALNELTDQLGQAEVVAAAANATHAAAAAALAERVRVTEELAARRCAVIELEEAAIAAAEQESAAREVSVVAEHAYEQSELAARRARARAEEARRKVDLVSDREEAGRLSSRLTKIEAARRELDRTSRDLAGILLTPEVVRAIGVAATAVERAELQTELVSARIELVAAGDVMLRVDGRDVPLSTGDEWTASASEPTHIELPGLISARIVPGAAAIDTRAVLDETRRNLGGLLRSAGVADVAEATAALGRRRELESFRERWTATLAGLCGDEPIAGLRSRLADLRERGCEADGQVVDAPSVRADLDAALVAYRQAGAQRDTDRKVAAAAAAKSVQQATKATVLREKLSAAHTELDAAHRRLTHLRATAGDDEIALRAQAEQDAALRARASVAEIRSRLVERGADAVAGELAEARRENERLEQRRDEIAGEVRDLTIQLRVFGTEGRKGELDAAESERSHAEREHRRVGRLARAARLLRLVMVNHRDTARLRYVEPFRAELERLGRLVFGDTFEVEVDSKLRICSRTVSGRTVPYESLSGGAKEQLGIIARLAGAALVAKEDAVPVIIDDALGFTDADRLVRMGPVFDAVGGYGQVIVLTCSPRRFDSVAGAHLIEIHA